MRREVAWVLLAICKIGRRSVTRYWYAIARSLTGHLDVAADRQQADTVVSVAPLEPEEAFAHADGEDFHAHAKELGRNEVTELVHQHHDAEHNDKCEGCVDCEGHSLRNL